MIMTQDVKERRKTQLEQQIISNSVALIEQKIFSRLIEWIKINWMQLLINIS